MGRREQEHAKRITLSREIRDRVKHEQGCVCPFCNTQFTERQLEVHHIKPVCFFKKGEGEIANKRENLVALCPPCHIEADRLVFQQNVFIDEVIEIPIFEAPQPNIDPV